MSTLKRLGRIVNCSFEFFCVAKNVQMSKNQDMNTLKKIFEAHGWKISIICKEKGIPYTTLWQHYRGTRKVTPEMAIRYESLLGIPRSELRPDLWPKEGDRYA